MVPIVGLVVQAAAACQSNATQLLMLAPLKEVTVPLKVITAVCRRTRA